MPSFRFRPHLRHRGGAVQSGRSDVFDGESVWPERPEKAVEFLALSFVPQPVIVPDRLFQVQCIRLVHVHRLLPLRFFCSCGSPRRAAITAPVFGKSGICLLFASETVMTQVENKALPDHVPPELAMALPLFSRTVV